MFNDLCPFPSLPLPPSLSSLPILPVPVTLLGVVLTSLSHFLGRLNSQLGEMKDDITGELGNVEFVCTIADIWSANNRSLWRDCHWIDPSSLRRRSASLACERMTGRHTYNAVAAKVDTVHTAYRIGSKVVMTVTDNGCNFVKAFKEFACDSSNNDADIVSFVEMCSV